MIENVLFNAVYLLLLFFTLEYSISAHVILPAPLFFLLKKKSFYHLVAFIVKPACVTLFAAF